MLLSVMLVLGNLRQLLKYGQNAYGQNAYGGEGDRLSKQLLVAALLSLVGLVLHFGYPSVLMDYAVSKCFIQDPIVFVIGNALVHS